MLHALRLAQWAIHALAACPQEQDLHEAEWTQLLETRLPQLGPQQRRHTLEATAIAAYHHQHEFPVIQLLLCDDAPQFNWLTADLALCWVHDGRHYQKLAPCVPRHQELLAAFMAEYWDFYDQLLAYREDPSPAEKARLTAEFDRLFATTTGYQQLDDRIAKTRRNKASLLLALDHPEIPLHNNAAELGARQRKRDVSFGPRTACRRPRLGYLPNAGRHDQEAGRQLLPLHPRSRDENQRPAQPGRPHPATRRRTTPGGVLAFRLTAPPDY